MFHKGKNKPERSQLEKDLDEHTTVHLKYDFDDAELSQALRYESSEFKFPTRCTEESCKLSRWKGQTCYLHGLVLQNKVQKKSD